jgi:myo-inositol-1(or 4)-monophosphatase
MSTAAPQPSSSLPPISVLCDAAREAGEIALRYFRKAPKTWTKPGNSPVTEADLAIDAMLHKELRRAYPAYGWLSEEIEDDGSRLSGQPTFVVDPIDGTRGFMAGHDDWAVSIGLVHAGRPQMGVLFNPVRGELMFAQSGHGAHVEQADGSVKPMRPSGKNTLEGAQIAFPGTIKPSHGFAKAPRLASLALRIASVAEGTFDGCVARPGAHHWDIAAADILAQEAGSPLVDMDGQALAYDGASIRHAVLLCASPALSRVLAGLVGER